MAGMRVEWLDHLGMVAGVCQEIGLGFSNRRLYLVSQFFATKPVEHLLGPGITADMLHDDCLGRTLDWLYDHDLTALFAGIARQARQRFGLVARQVHVDTASFSVSGAYAPAPDPGDPEAADAHAMAVTYGSSRDHRADLKQWMLATTRQGDVPVFCQALDGNASDKVSLLAAVEALTEQLRPAEEDRATGEAAGTEAPIFVRTAACTVPKTWRSSVARGCAGSVGCPTPPRRRGRRCRWPTAPGSRTRWIPLGRAGGPPVAQPPDDERWLVVRTTLAREEPL